MAVLALISNSHCGRDSYDKAEKRWKERRGGRLERGKETDEGRTIRVARRLQAAFVLSYLIATTNGDLQEERLLLSCEKINVLRQGSKIFLLSIIFLEKSPPYLTPPPSFPSHPQNKNERRKERNFLSWKIWGGVKKKR